MPILNLERPIKRITLPSSTPDDEAWVEVYADERLVDAENVDIGMSAAMMGVATLSKIIANWNFTDASGEKMEIKYDTVKMIDRKDYEHIQAELNKLHPQTIDEDKKKESESSSKKNMTAMTPQKPLDISEKAPGHQ